MYSNTRQQGFILPALIVLSLLLMSMGLVALQYVASSTNSVQSAFYNNMSKEVANAGASLAYSCLRSNGGAAQWTGSEKALTVGSDCAGITYAGGIDCAAGRDASIAPDTSTLSQGSNGSWKSRFIVCEPTVGTGGISYIAKGIVEFYYAGSSTPTRSFTSLTKVNIPYDLSASTVRKAVGKAVTQMESGGNSNCAIANQQLYCWGVNNVGQMAQGGSDTASRSSPTLITTGALSGKRVTYTSMGYTNGCAIADGRSYCWAINQRGQLGNGTAPGFLSDFDIVALLAATRYQPTQVTGPLANVNTTKISASWALDNNADRSHSCALANGAVYCWGSNYYGQLGQPKYEGAVDVLCAASGWVAGYILFVPSSWLCPKPEYTGMSIGDNHDYYSPSPILGFGSRPQESQGLFYGKRVTDFDTGVFGDCAIANGSVYCWGENTLQVRGSADPLGGLTTQSTNALKQGDLSGRYATSVAAASTSACAVADGRMNCWGRLRGDGVDNVVGNSTPKAVTGLPDGDKVIDKVKSSTELSGPICGFGSGDSYCWGLNQPGTASPLHVRPTMLNTNESITDGGTGGGAAGLFGIGGTPGNSCYVANATVYCIGNNEYGQLGNGTTGGSSGSSFVKANTIGLTDGKAATDISSGTDYSCAIIDGQPYCWGNGSSGKLGNGDSLNRTHPYGVNGLPDSTSSTQVTTGNAHSCSITGGHAYCWGSNASGQVGSGANNPQLSARLVTGSGFESMAVTDISAGRDHTCAVANSKAYCWGLNTYGQLGNNTTTATGTPTAVRANSGDALYGKQVTKIVAGDRFTCAIADGQPYCWGERASGKIGNGGSTSGNTLLPAAVSNMTGASTDLEAGPDYACAIESGIPKCWGENQYYQLGINSTVDQTTPATNTTLQGSSSNPKNTTSMALGTSSACAITNGTTYCWGSRANGRIGNGGTTTGNTTTPTAITEVNSTTDLGPQNTPYKLSAGSFGSCAIANARIYCWGDGSQGQMGTDTTPSATLAPGITADYTRDVTIISWANTIFY